MNKIIESIDFLHEYCNFDNPKEVWILKGLSRNKDNDENAERFMRRLVIARPEDIEPCYNDLRRMGNAEGTTYRMYVSINSRDVVKGLFNFQKTMLDVAYGLARGLDDALVVSKKIGSKWKTELEQRTNRGTKRFLIDIDEDDVYLKDLVVSELDSLEGKGLTKIRAIRRTVNGWGISVDACDLRDFKNTFKDNDVSVQNDSMLFIESWKGVE